MAQIVYLLCGFASLLCTVLLARAWRSSHVPLLRWSAICFGGLTISNILLFIDLVMLPSVDLFPLRNFLSLVSLGALIFGYFKDRN